MNVIDAGALLDTAQRIECHDQAFGDREIFWALRDTTPIASGYAGAGIYEVFILEDAAPDAPAKFEGEEAKRLLMCGHLQRITRNDSEGI